MTTATTTDRVAAFISAVESHTGCKAKAKTGNDRVQYSLCCPSHDDSNASLSVAEGDDGRILLKCFAGCRPEDIVNAVGLRMKDVMPEPTKSAGTLGEVEKVYKYRNADGTVAFEVVRYRPKNFRQRVPLGGGQYNWSMRGVTMLPYRLPELIASDPAEWVFCCEGEKDADAIAAHGQVATCSAGGAGKWKAEYGQYFQGRRVCVIADADTPGRKHAQDVARHLHGVAATVRVAEVLEGKDASDWLAALSDDIEKGEALVGLAETTADWSPSPAPETVTVDDAPTTHGEPKPTCVTVRLSTVTPESVTWQGPFAVGKLNVVGGYGEAGKTTAVLDMIARETTGRPFPHEATAKRDPGDVILLSCEDGLGDTVVPRLIAADADLSRVLAITGVRQPEDKSGFAQFTFDRDIRRLEETWERECTNCRMIVVDPFSAYLGNVDSYRDSEVRAVLGPLAEFASRRKVTVVAVMHLSKTIGRRAIEKMLGSVAFTNAARVVHMVKADAADRSRVYFGCAKNNLGPRQPTLAFRLTSKQTSVGSYATAIWEPAAVEMDVEELFGDAPAGVGRPPVVRDEAVKLIQEMLASGPRLQSEVLRAAQQKGISEGTLRAGKKMLGVLSTVMSFGGIPDRCSWWYYPGTV